VMSTSNSILLAFFLHLPELSTPLSPNLMKQRQHSTLANSFFCRRRSASLRVSPLPRKEEWMPDANSSKCARLLTTWRLDERHRPTTRRQRVKKLRVSKF
jgi:hypothetical protein